MNPAPRARLIAGRAVFRVQGLPSDWNIPEERA
jgi:hypothetical protein